MGAAGFFGSAIVRALARDGFQVHACDLVPASGFALRRGTPRESVVYSQRDIVADTLDDLVESTDGIIHAAAITPPDDRADAHLHRALAVNVSSLGSVFRAIGHSRRGSRLLLISSSAVYDQSTPGTLLESDASGGLSFYGATKFAAELVARQWCNGHGIDFCAVRPTSLIGPGESVRESRPRPSGFLKLVIAALAGRSVRLSRPESRADWLSVDDAADAVSLLWRKDRFGALAFNLSTGAPARFSDVAAAVKRAAGLRLSDDAQLVVDGGADLPAVIAHDAIAAAVRWRPSRMLDEVVLDLLKEGVSDKTKAAVLSP